MLYGKTPFFHENADVMYKNILEGEPSFPKDLKYSQEAIEFIKLLLKKSTAERLGYDDEQEIFTHPWFNEIDFPKLLTKALPAKIIPHVDEEILQWINADSTEENTKELTKLDLSFEIEEERAKKRAAKRSMANPSMLIHQQDKEDSFDDFSYFEEEEFVETAVHDHFERALLNEKFEEEKRVQLLTNQPEYSFEASEEDSCKGDQHKRDALNSPRDHSGRRAYKYELEDEYPDENFKLSRRRSSYDGKGLNSDKSKGPGRKGSDVKQKKSTQKRSDSGERVITGQILQFSNVVSSNPNIPLVPVSMKPKVQLAQLSNTIAESESTTNTVVAANPCEEGCTMDEQPALVSNPAA